MKSWRSKTQSVVARISKEGERVALAMYFRELVGFRSLKMFGKALRKEQIEKLMMIWIAKDDQGCITAAYNFECPGLSKHVNVEHQFVQKNLEKINIWLHYFPTYVMTADNFTKKLKSVKPANLIELTKMQ